MPHPVVFPSPLRGLAAAALCLSVGAVRAQPTPAPATPPAAAAAAPASALPAIFVCGDSTANNNGRDKQGQQLQGWGTPLANYFDPAKVTVKNVGHAGTSSLTYYNGDWPKVLPQIKAGDYVLLVFGINDGGLGTPAGLGDEVKEVTVRNNKMQAHTYGWYMSKMAADAKEKGAHPYLLTVTVRNMWTNPKVKFKDATPTGPLPADYDAKQDKIIRGDKFALLTVEIGKARQLPVLDLNNLEADQYEKMGRETVNAFYSDHNHTYARGADAIASYIVSGLKAFKHSPFIPLLSEKGQAVPAADAKYVLDNLPAAK